jgi:hypothetical protein
MPLLLSIIFFIFFSCAFVFLYQKINDNNQKAEQKTITWKQESLRRDEMQSLNSSFQNMTNSQALLETHFIKSSDVVPFLNTIEALGPAVGASAEIDSVDTSPDGASLIVELQASGSFGAVYKFLTLLENSPYDFLSMDIHTITDVVPNKKVTTPKWEADFKIQLLSFVP